MEILKFENEDIEIIKNKDFEFLISTFEVAKGFGVKERVIRDHKSNHSDELIEGKHFFTITQENAKHFNIELHSKVRTKIFWTKRGIIRLGFFIKSERAKRFRDWAEDLILGSYSISKTPENPLKKRTEDLEFASRQTSAFRISFQNIGITKSEELGITVNRAVKNETEIDFIKLAGKEGIETDTKFRTVTDLCKFIRGSDKFSDEIKLSVSTKKNDKPRPQNLNQILESQGFQEKIDGDWKATEKGEIFSQFVQNKSKYSVKTVYHTVWKLEILKEIF